MQCAVRCFFFFSLLLVHLDLLIALVHVISPPCAVVVEELGDIDSVSLLERLAYSGLSWCLEWEWDSPPAGVPAGQALDVLLAEYGLYPVVFQKTAGHTEG